MNGRKGSLIRLSNRDIIEFAKRTVQKRMMGSVADSDHIDQWVGWGGGGGGGGGVG